MRIVCAVLVSALSAVSLVACGAGSSRSTPSQTATAALPGSLEQQFVSAVKEIQPEVVQIRTPTGLGSGVIFDANGNIVTNAHVVANSTEFAVFVADGHQYPAKLVGSYVPDDLAVIKISGAQKLKAARFADSSRLEVGDIVLAAGNPLGLQSSITDGIVSALGRNVSESRGIVLPNVIQTSAPINPGNSGGALVNLAGQVVGIPTLAAANPQLGTAASGIGFAVASNTVRDIAGQIVQYGRVINSHRAALGVSLADSIAESGALVAALEPAGPAEKSGIAVGDSIDQIDDKTVTDASALANILAGLKPGQVVKISVMRPDGSRATMSVTLEQLPTGG